MNMLGDGFVIIDEYLRMSTVAEILTQLDRSLSGKSSATCLTVNSADNIVVYRHNYLWSLLEALRRRYPTVATFLQEDNFKYMAREYIADQPSSDSNIDNYGDSLPTFLARRPELMSYPYLADLARLDDLCFQQDKSVTVAKGTVELWRAIQDDLDPQVTIDPNTVEVVTSEEITTEVDR